VVLLIPWELRLSAYAMCFWTRNRISTATRARAVPLGFQGRDAAKGEGQNADQGMGADAVWSSVINRRDLDIRF
jgi:hypothetical protein